MTTPPKMTATKVRESLVAGITRPMPVGRHEAAAKALADAGILARANQERAAAVLERHFVATAPRAYNWAADSEYLHQAIAHHLGAYTRQVLEPKVRSFHQKNATGRLLKEDDVEAAAEEVTSLVAAEMSESYRADIARYVGDGDGFLSYVFVRVRNLLIEEALAFNQKFISHRMGQQNAAAIVAPAPPK